MSKFHINPNTGGISRCRAEVKCPFGGESGMENHYDSVREAKVGVEKLMESQEGLFKSVSRTPDYGPEHEEISTKIQEVKRLYSRVDSKIKAAVTNDPDVKGTDKWLKAVLYRKKLAYYRNRLAMERDQLLPEDVQEKLRISSEERSIKAQEKANSWKSDDYNHHPDITLETAKPVRQTIKSFTGRSDKSIEAEVNKLVENGATLTEAYREVWDKAELRTDKPIVAIDIETAAPLWGGRVDMGPNSSIIEVGYVKRDVDGTVTEKSYLFDVPEDLKVTDGTGAEHIHNISLAMIQGKPVFNESPKHNKELLDVLRGSVMVAHNVNYENSQFTHNVPGFKKMVDAGEVEMLDTRIVSKFFVPEAPTNSNNDFVVATGGKYEGGHRALEDAKMSLNALFRSKGVPEI